MLTKNPQIWILGAFLAIFLRLGGGIFGRFFGIIRCVSLSYEFWYPICQPRLKDVGVITKNLKFGVFGAFWAILRALGAYLDVFWHDPMRLIELRILVPHMPPRLKDLGVVTKQRQIWLFWRVLGDFARFRRRVWAIFWHDLMRSIELRILVPYMPT